MASEPAASAPPPDRESVGDRVRRLASSPGFQLVENVVFAGSGTQPGVGVPMVLVSGRLAAERILGPSPSPRRH